MRSLNRPIRWGRRACAAMLSLVSGAAWVLLPVVSSRAADGVAQARAEVAEAEARPSFVAPGAPFDIGKLKGKHVWIITSTMAVPFVATIAHGVEAAAKVASLGTTLFDGKGDVSEWNRGMAQAVSQHADGIVTVGASPELMKGPTADALAARIPVVDALTADKSAPLVSGTFAHVTISFYHSGQIQADYAIASSGGKAHVLIFGDNEFPGEVSRVEGMRHEFKMLCPDCTVIVQDTQVGNLGVRLGQMAQTLLRRDPDVTMVLPTYDAQAIYIVPAIKAANLSNPPVVVGSDAVDGNLNWIRLDNVQVADVGEPDVWCGWAAIDEVARGMLGLKPVDEQIPLRLFVKANLEKVSNDENALFGGDFVAEYRKLWGLP